MADRIFTWIDVNGTPWPLDASTNYLALADGPAGLLGIPTAVVTQDTPMLPGTIEKYIQLQPGQPTLPIAIFANSEDELDTARRALKTATQANRGLGTLRHQANDGTVRDLKCKVVGGWAEAKEGGGNRAGGLLIVELTFFAADPFWYDTDFTQRLFTIATGAGIFDTPAILPIKLAPSGIASSASIENTGDAVAWPIWVLSGPMTSAVFTNNTTGDTMTIVKTLIAGQSITIDTTPTNKTITREDNSKHFEYLSPVTGTLWGLATGTNSISVTVAGTGAGSLLTLQYKQRYEGI